MIALSGQSASTAVIGGSGFYALAGLQATQALHITTPFGRVTDLIVGRLDGKCVAFLARHGLQHKVPPHLINYRANIHALHQLGVKSIIAVNAVGGINAQMGPAELVVPNQLIDYTHGRPQTFVDSLSEAINHIDFAQPFSDAPRQALLQALRSRALGGHGQAVYACTQGPRLETAAEVDRLERDGCDIVGMTVMPEAALARELGMEYAALCTVVNWAAGRADEIITMQQVLAILQGANATLQAVVAEAIRRLAPI